MMTIGERHVRKFRQLLKAEGLAAVRFDLLDVAWVEDKKTPARSFFTEKNVTALEHIASVFAKMEASFDVITDAHDFWFCCDGRPCVYFYSRIDSHRGITIAIFRTNVDVAAIEANNVRTTISSYIDGGDYALERVITTSDGSSEQITDIATKILESKISVVSNRPDGGGIDFLLTNNNEVLLLQFDTSNNDRITVRLSKVEAL